MTAEKDPRIEYVIPPDIEYRRLRNGMRVYDLVFGICWWSIWFLGIPVLLMIGFSHD